jgi:hypothetical protein
MPGRRSAGHPLVAEGIVCYPTQLKPNAIVAASAARRSRSWPSNRATPATGVIAASPKQSPD